MIYTFKNTRPPNQVMTDSYKERRGKIEALFSDNNRLEDTVRKELSTKGKYKLEIAQYKISEKGWNYSRGIVRRDDTIIADVKRNYCQFPFLLVEEHPNGHDYLICGEDYQGQTVVELDTGKRLDHLSDDADQGFGFCWRGYAFDKDSSILTVEGCYWACPDEFRFYDFSAPMKGWPEIKTEDFISSCEKVPVIGRDGIIKCFEIETNEDGEAIIPHRDSSIKTLRRDGNKLILLDEWVSDSEQERREKSEKMQKEYNKWMIEFRTTDPLYLTYQTLLADKRLNPEDHESIGITHENWCPDFKLQEKRMCRRILKSDYTVDLEWAVSTGPIKLVIFNQGKHVEDKYFSHSEDGMNKAFDYIKSIAT